MTASCCSAVDYRLSSALPQWIFLDHKTTADIVPGRWIRDVVLPQRRSLPCAGHAAGPSAARATPTAIISALTIAYAPIVLDET
jgi:hypothetical protein